MDPSTSYDEGVTCERVCDGPLWEALFLAPKTLKIGLGTDLGQKSTPFTGVFEFVFFNSDGGAFPPADMARFSPKNDRLTAYL